MLTIRDEQMQAMSAALGQPLVMPCNPTWVEFQLLDEDNQPVPNVAYSIKLPDGSSMTGKLDGQGTVRFDRISAGQCQISFPAIDAKEWRPA